MELGRRGFAEPAPRREDDRHLTAIRCRSCGSHVDLSRRVPILERCRTWFASPTRVTSPWRHLVNATRQPTRSTEAMSGKPEWVTRRTPTTIYRQPGLYITTEWFVIGERRYPIWELTNLRTGRGRRDPLTVRSMMVTAVVVAGVGATLGYVRELNDISPATYLALGAAAMVPMLTAAIGHRLRPRPYELWADIRGRAVMIFASDQERIYGQVTRALIRAKEAARYGGIADPLASAGQWPTVR
ncbi:DUF6232 family protein [Polymorphospora rubra]